MKLLKDILYGTRMLEVLGSTNIAIENVSADSRKIQKNGLFVATRGTVVDGHDFIPTAIKNKAIAVVCEEFPAELASGVAYIKVADSQKSLGIIASNFFDQPSKELKLVGVTGTNGKTTVATLLYQAFRELGYKVGLLSTVVNKINFLDVPATHTTPDPVTLNSLLRQMANAGCSFCFMEVSSHAVVQERIAGLTFAGAIFTNITHDHLDYHKTFDNYLGAKKQFFDQLPTNAFAITNKDDKNGLVMVQNTKARVYTYALLSPADIKVKIIDNQLSGLHLVVDGTEVHTRLIGKFNAYNLAAIYTAGIKLGQDPLQMLTVISNLSAVAGRFQYIKTGGNVTAIVDYAHTPDALENVLKTIQDIRSGNEKIITVVGCGGDRDKAKRPEMAAIAVRMSDKVILTSDNPRTEDPNQIINDMKAGIGGEYFAKYTTIADRLEAIKTACVEANAGDILLIAGKGHENYQEIQGVKHPFNDYEITQATLKILKK
ncbi:MAG TPA: UDP-N-acetylmuramoyl-L-alanyl-D-glutamate--2,6-diaminopimelate ligase [Luteibaculaceae bacterium]|nr:UDP-N-acetylmuramoyl-L-alanyl-D-glutamate--2,6-diaminopimelate ligase [Luteibaculaceae bacterium]